MWPEPFIGTNHEIGLHRNGYIYAMMKGSVYANSWRPREIRSVQEFEEVVLDRLKVPMSDADREGALAWYKANIKNTEWTPTCENCGKPMVCGGWCVNDPRED